jgi:hypothetical protein
VYLKFLNTIQKATGMKKLNLSYNKMDKEKFLMKHKNNLHKNLKKIIAMLNLEENLYKNISEMTSIIHLMKTKSPEINLKYMLTKSKDTTKSFVLLKSILQNFWSTKISNTP